MRSAFVGVAVLLLCSCVTTSQRYQHEVSKQTGCPAEEIAVDLQPLPGLETASPAVACGRTFSCVTRGSFSYAPWVECTETAASKQSTTDAAVIERLALETGCLKEKIRIDNATGWSVGGERAYRLSACEKPFVCTAAPGRIDCKQALSAEQSQ